MSPTDRRTTAEALPTLAVLNRESRRRGDREKRESEILRPPAEFDRDPVMEARSIMPMPMPQENAEHEKFVEGVRPTQTSEERLRQQALANHALWERRSQRTSEAEARAALAGLREQREVTSRKGTYTTLTRRAVDGLLPVSCLTADARHLIASQYRG